MAKKTTIIRASLAIVCASLVSAAYWIGRVSRPPADQAPAPAVSAAPREAATAAPAAPGKPVPEGSAAVTSPALHPAQVLPSPPNAASHLAFRETQRCYLTASKLAIQKRMADCSPMNGRPGLELQYAACLNRVVDHQDQIRAARATMASCGDEKTLVRRYFEATKSAANNGDIEAQLCYVSGAFADADGTTHYTDEDLAEYRVTAPAYVDAALERGDWRMVGVLSRRFVDGFELSRLLDRIGEPETIYKMDALLQMGAIGDYADALSSAMQNLALSPSSVTAAGDWARITYARSFSGSPPLHDAPAVCGADDDAEN